jgi:autotransporter-associated beta strand protein
LGSIAAGGSYSQITLKPLGTGTLTVDGTVNAGTSVVAAAPSSGTLSLKVQAPVLTPLFDIQNGVNATFLSGGSLSSTGTLQIEGNVALSGQSMNFGNIALKGGSLFGGTLATGSLSATSGTLGTILGGSFGNLTKTDTGILTITGSSTAYAGTLQVTAGTVKLGNSAALGSTGRVSFAA